MVRAQSLLLLVPILALGCGREPQPSVSRPDPEAVISANLKELGIEEEMARSQRYCAVRTKNRLGSMGVPVKLTLKDDVIFLCCEGCVKAAEKDLEGAVKKAAELHIQTAMEQLDPADRALAEAQRYCASDGMTPLGSMGAPTKIMVQGQPVFLCCAGCESVVREDEAGALALVKKLQADHAKK